MHIHTCPRCRGGQSSISDQSLWDFWCRKWHWDGYSYPSTSVFPACITPAPVRTHNSFTQHPSNQHRRYVKLFSHPSFPPQLCIIIFHSDEIGSGTQLAPFSMVNEGSFLSIKMADTWHQHSSRFVTEVKNTCISTCIFPYGCTVWYLIKLGKFIFTDVLGSRNP